MSMLDLQQYAQDLTPLRKTLVEAGDALHIENLKETLEELTEEMKQPEFWNDADHANKINQKVGTIRAKIEHYEGLLSLADDIEVAMEMAEDEQDEAMVEEAGTMLADLKEKTAALELETLMRGQYDDSNAILSLHAGAGGTEAQDWTGMLYRMYTRYCEQMGFQVKVLDYLDGDEAGVKSVTFEVSGDHAYGYLRGEKGVHRLVRISPFDSNARRHTSFSSLDVAPIMDDTINALNPPICSLTAISAARGAPPISLANNMAGTTDGSICKYFHTNENTGSIILASQGVMTIIPIIDNAIAPSNPKPFSNSFPNPNLPPII